MKTREEIFAESDRRYPDFGGFRDHGLSLGFETGATWAGTFDEPPLHGTVMDKSFAYFPVEAESEQVNAWRRTGFIAGVTWVWEKAE